MNSHQYSRLRPAGRLRMARGLDSADQPNTRWINRLRELPEAGMVYHRVDVVTADGRMLRDIIVFNSELIELPDEAGTITIRELQPHRKS